MKKNIKFILLCIIVLIVSLFVFNKTFFKSNYNGFKIPLFTYYKNNNLYSIRTSKSLNNSINKYLNSLDKCDKYYYDKSIDKSIDYKDLTDEDTSTIYSNILKNEGITNLLTDFSKMTTTLSTLGTSNNNDYEF